MRRRGGAQNAEGRRARRDANPRVEDELGLAPPHTDIRPTHVCKYGYRWELPARPRLNIPTEVRVFRPSDDQRAKRCDGCARSHQASRLHCYANHGNENSAIIPEDCSQGQPDDTPLDDEYIFHSLTHDDTGKYKGIIRLFSMGRNGRNYKGGRATIVIRGTG